MLTAKNQELIDPLKECRDHPLTPWERNPFQLLSWSSMEKFSAETFYRLAKILERMRIHYGLETEVKVYSHPRSPFHSTAVAADLPITIEQQDELVQLCANVSTLCRDIGLRQSAKCAEAVWHEFAVLLEDGSAVLATPAPQRRHVSYLVREIDHSIDREIEDHFFVYIPALEAQYYNVAALFGEKTNDAFPKAADDIKEAGNCYASGRSTACVFHLMRTMEVGLRALGASLNDPTLDPKKNPTWERILERGDKELQKKYDDRSSEWKANSEFFATATANLRAVKDAWRNPSLHVERDYDQQQALEVLNAVRAFMRHLADKLKSC